MKRLLIIEDQEKTLSYLIKGFREQSFIVETATDGEEALYHIHNHHYDLVILDVMMPKYNGWDIIKIIRKNNASMPVIFLTACDEIENKVRGFDLGGDDYLVKPFSFSELLARVRSLLRRTNIQTESTLKIADLTIDLIKHKALRNQIVLDLTAKEFSLLAFLAQHTGEVLSRTLLAERVWDINFDSDTNVIDVAIRRLRKKVDDPFEKKLIHTLRGVGYVLE